MESYSEIRQAIAQNEMEHARDLLRDVLKAQPDSAEVWYLAALAARNPAQRRAFLEKAVELDPLYAPAANALHRMNTPQTFEATSPDESRKQQPSTYSSMPTVTDQSIAGRRLAAGVIDAVMIGVLQFMAFFLLTLLLVPATVNSMDEMNSAAMSQGALVMFFLLMIPATYYPLCMTRMNGQTVGKRILKLRVIKRDGSALNGWDAFLRCYVGYLLSAAGLGAGFLWMLVDARQQGWHDMVADTVVIEG